jgi:hypothetical protein
MYICHMIDFYFFILIYSNKSIFAFENQCIYIGLVSLYFLYLDLSHNFFFCSNANACLLLS